jgi:hypothetical protein
MHWDAYTVFSVISGVALIGMGIAARLSVKYRVYALIGGAFFIGYGFYVAKQTTGTYFFSVWVFIIPVIAIGYLVAAAAGVNKPRTSRSVPGAAGSQPQSGSAAAAVAPASPVARPATAPGLAERPAAWSPPPAQPAAAQLDPAQPALAQPGPPRAYPAQAGMRRVFCTQCGTQGVPGGSFCGECGTPMHQVR